MHVNVCDTICMGVYILYTFLLIFSEICDVGLEITDQDLQNAHLKWPLLNHTHSKARLQSK